MSQLLRLVSRTDRLAKPEGLAAALRGSGIFLEPGLRAAESRSGESLQLDMKAGLFRALAQVDAALAKMDAVALQGRDALAMLELRRELEGGLGRIILHQLNSQPVDGAPHSRSWQLELPLLHAGVYDSLRVELEQERRHDRDEPADDADKDCWRVTLQLAPPALGALRVRLQLRGDELELQIAAARKPVRALIDAGVPVLQQALASRGITLLAAATAELAAESPAGEPRRATGGALDLRV